MATLSILACDRCKKPETEAPGIVGVTVIQQEMEDVPELRSDRDLCTKCRDGMYEYLDMCRPLARTRAPK